MKKYALYFHRLDGSWVKVTGTDKQFNSISNSIMRAFGVSGVYTEEGFLLEHDYSELAGEFVL